MVIWLKRNFVAFAARFGGVLHSFQRGSEALMAKLHSSEPLDIEDLEGEVCAMELSEGVKERILSEERRGL